MRLLGVLLGIVMTAAGITLAQTSASGSVSSQATFEALHELREPGPWNVIGPLTLARSGFIYGAGGSGAANSGTIFRLTPSGGVQVLHTFPNASMANAGGFGVSSPLVEGPDGNLYGATSSGGPSKAGTIFRVTPAGVVKVLHTFSKTDGESPSGQLAVSKDGTIYGSTSSGPRGASTVFKLTPDGKLLTLHDFIGGKTGRPHSVMLARDGNLYLTTSEGGDLEFGTILRLTPAGELTTLHSFQGQAEGGHPSSFALLQTEDGAFGGTTGGGPGSMVTAMQTGRTSMSLPTVFKMENGKLVTSARLGGSDNYSGVIRARDGRFYATTSGGGVARSGSVIRIENGTVTTIYSFPLRADDARPYSGLTQGADGKLYGVTMARLPSGGGTIFRLTVDGR